MRGRLRIAFLIVGVLFFFAPGRAMAQFNAVYGNGLLLPTLTLNVGVDIGLSSRTSLDLNLAINPLSTPKLRIQFAMIQPGFRYWLSEIQFGHFFGVHLLGAVYHVGNERFHTRGFAAGVGVSWGYNWLITKRFNIGVELGIGMAYMRDSRQDYHTPDSDDHYIFHTSRLALLPTKCAVNFVYLF